MTYDNEDSFNLEDLKLLSEIIGTIFIFGTLGAFIGGNVVHESLNWMIFNRYGISAQVTWFGEMHTNDCPWNCQPYYIATAWTSFNTTQLNKLLRTNPEEFNEMYTSIVFNESTPWQSFVAIGFMVAFSWGTAIYVYRRGKKKMDRREASQ